ncbi:sensor histidine kinase [Spirillospora sp. CA-294931]|uniref:sensor histidine kinase n=1 Tax=Spirillospora sp. CA-294931 TaxID=3240042 RepID=UPI003D8DA384
MIGSRGRPRTAAARIRRLRRRITALFALTSLVTLSGLALLAVHNDDRAWREQLDRTLNLRTTEAMYSMTYEGRRLDPTEMASTVDTDCPALTVLAGPVGRLGVVHAPSRPCVRARDGDVRHVARTAMRTGEVATADVRAGDGRGLRLLADPFEGEKEYEPDGAVVAAVDASEDRAAHRRLTLVLTGGCAVLVALSALAGRFLAGRAVRPALAALHQQEAFLADVAHDLRNPAASMRALAETGLRGESDPREALRRAARLSTRMGDLVDGLLTRARLMAGVDALTRAPLRLDQLVETVVADSEAGDRIAVETEPVVVDADPGLLTRAVGNLVDNALVHGHAPGRDAEIAVTVRADGTVTVDDAGPGLPPGLEASLFERFRSGSGSTGLGLSITSWAAHAHGGTLTAGTSPSGGARFVLRLPPR